MGGWGDGGIWDMGMGRWGDMGRGCGGNVCGMVGDGGEDERETIGGTTGGGE